MNYRLPLALHLLLYVYLPAFNDNLHIFNIYIYIYIYIHHRARLSPCHPLNASIDKTNV